MSRKNVFYHLEMMIAFLIVIVMIFFGLPPLWQAFENDPRSNLANHFTEACLYARMEAVRQNNFVSICASANNIQTACLHESETLKSWKNGWILFLDHNGNGIYNPADGDVLFRFHDVLPDQSSIDSTAADSTTIITYNRNGYLTRGSGQYIIKSGDCSDGHGLVKVTLGVTGKPTTQEIPCPK